MNRRLVLGLGATAGLGVLASVTQRGQAAGPRGYFFAPSDQQTRDLEDSVSRSLPGWDVTVFGKARDLEAAVEQWGSDAVVAPKPTLESLGMKVDLTGKLKGSTTEPYVIVSVGDSLDPSDLSGQTVGMLGLMGRREMKSLSEQVLGIGDARLKTVTKYRDLLPLLQFRAARAVALPERFVGVLTNRSELNLVVSRLPRGRVGVTSASVRNSQLTSAIRSIPHSTLTKLGVDEWI